jgi:hypothetical protein
MAYLAKYKKSDFKKVSWDEYGKTLEKLYKKVATYVRAHKIKIDVVVPILRGGLFPGAYLAYRFHLLRILPIQYHYLFTKKKIELRKILDLPRRSLNLPRKPTFLLVEGNHCFGLTAGTAAKDLKKAFPGCKIIYATDHIDYSYQKIDNVDAIFYGKLTNETRALSKKECKKKGIENPLCYLFPWEDLKEEWTTVQGKQFRYKDLEVMKRGKLKAKIPKA